MVSEITIDKICSVDFEIVTQTNQSNLLQIIRGNHDQSPRQICKLISFAVDGLDISEVMDFGKFYPFYPQPWYDEQLAQNIVWPEYHERWREWGWSGQWQLEYSSPFFTWLLRII